MTFGSSTIHRYRHQGQSLREGPVQIAEVADLLMDDSFLQRLLRA